MGRALGLAPLSVLGEAPHRVVEAAAGAGFDFVGLRVQRVSEDEPFFALNPGGSELRRTRQALDDTGLTVLDVECLVFDGTVGPETWLPALEAGAALGARVFTVAASDTDRSRIADSLGEFTRDAMDFNIVPMFEPMAYRTVSTLAEAAVLARGAGCLVLPDTLHFHRAGTTPDMAREVADLVVMVQLCDAPAEPPADLDGYIEESRSHRLLPGAGGADVYGFLNAFLEGVPVSVEVPHPSRHEIGLEAFVRELAIACRAGVDGAALQRVVSAAVGVEPSPCRKSIGPVQPLSLPTRNCTA
ncbi:sugar phosphate isomerase/epimerase family protein [Austwickia chelonae]|uniref:sugar phosphate isomerase/epimerase family protein n=1 Tax=Austwickia chelonae TaxID=100225 RepID=UPI0013C35F0D|nr:TIM barrel protein [Austwickia chelonae]